MSDRKQQHIDLALQSSMDGLAPDNRFYYEPLLAAHPAGTANTIDFLGRQLKFPFWVSSMTGGTATALGINHTIARICNEFGVGMALGSCRRLIEDNSWFDQYNVRPILGEKLPFFTNLGISQVERMLAEGTTDKICKLNDLLQADGLVVHINPMQEWMQPEGNEIVTPPLETIERLLEATGLPVIVKEVGQGMGPVSLERLFDLPLAAIELGAYGGTNFFEVERQRSPVGGYYSSLTRVGHSADEMIDIINNLIDKKSHLASRQIIISGGVKDFLDGYYYLQKCKAQAIYGQAAPILRYALLGEKPLREYMAAQVKGFALAKQFLKIKRYD